jgi:maltose O-acetyltransferase
MMTAHMISEDKARMIRGELYHANDAELAADRLRCRIMVDELNQTRATDDILRHNLLHDLLGHLGSDSQVYPRFECDYGYQIRIGDRTVIHANANIRDAAAVTIGDDVYIGPSVLLLTTTRPMEASLRRTGVESAAPITIRFGAWLGGGVIVGPGVTIGGGAVVSHGAVVTEDVPPRALVAGNPARVVRTL